MNKIVLYVGLAILLGTVTMVAPLALLQDGNPILDAPQFTKSGLESENQTTNDYETFSPEVPADSMLEIPEPREPAETDA